MHNKHEPVINLFPVLIYNNKVESHDEIYKHFSPYIDQDKYFTEQRQWDCDVETTRNYPNSYKELPWNIFLKDVINNHLLPFINNNLKPKEAFDIKVSGIWMNRYKKGQYQEMHNHIGRGGHLSCSYILKTDVDSGDFKIPNPYYDIASACGLSYILDYQSQYYTAPNEEGSLLIFPSYLNHFVTHNSTDKTRVSISANFELINRRIF